MPPDGGRQVDRVGSEERHHEEGEGERVTSHEGMVRGEPQSGKKTTIAPHDAETGRPQRSLGLLHALFNVLGLGCFVGSLLARGAGKRAVC
jgi:hypothetical protein